MSARLLVSKFSNAVRPGHRHVGAFLTANEWWRSGLCVKTLALHYQPHTKHVSVYVQGVLSFNMRDEAPTRAKEKKTASSMLAQVLGQ